MKMLPFEKFEEFSLELKKLIKELKISDEYSSFKFGILFKNKKLKEEYLQKNDFLNDYLIENDLYKKNSFIFNLIDNQYMHSNLKLVFSFNDKNSNVFDVVIHQFDDLDFLVNINNTSKFGQNKNKNKSIIIEFIKDFLINKAFLYKPIVRFVFDDNLQERVLESIYKVSRSTKETITKECFLDEHLDILSFFNLFEKNKSFINYDSTIVFDNKSYNYKLTYDEVNKYSIVLYDNNIGNLCYINSIDSYNKLLELKKLKEIELKKMSLELINYFSEKDKNFIFSNKEFIIFNKEFKFDYNYNYIRSKYEFRIFNKSFCVNDLDKLKESILKSFEQKVIRNKLKLIINNNHLTNLEKLYFKTHGKLKKEHKILFNFGIYYDIDSNIKKEFISYLKDNKINDSFNSLKDFNELQIGNFTIKEVLLSSRKYYQIEKRDI